MLEHNNGRKHNNHNDRFIPQRAAHRTQAMRKDQIEDNTPDSYDSLLSREIFNSGEMVD